LQKSSETARCDTLQGRPCQLDGGIPPADGRTDPPPITFGTIDTFGMIENKPAAGEAGTSFEFAAYDSADPTKTKGGDLRSPPL